MSYRRHSIIFRPLGLEIEESMLGAGVWKSLTPFNPYSLLYDSKRLFCNLTSNWINFQTVSYEVSQETYQCKQVLQLLKLKEVN